MRFAETTTNRIAGGLHRPMAKKEKARQCFKSCGLKKTIHQL
jgi:hypothetical protein